MKKGFIVLDLYFLFFCSFDLLIANFQQFGPIRFDILQFTNDFKEILTALGDFFFWPEGVWEALLSGPLTLSTFISGLLMYIKFIISIIGFNRYLNYVFGKI